MSSSSGLPIRSYGHDRESRHSQTFANEASTDESDSESGSEAGSTEDGSVRDPAGMRSEDDPAADPGQHTRSQTSRQERHGPPIFWLSDELLVLILKQIEGDSRRLIPIEDRAYLSQESFRLPPSPPPDAIETLGNFRLTCRKFSQIGVERQFSRVATRFSSRGFSRLEAIAQQPHLAQAVKKFSYLVPWFYTLNNQRAEELLPTVAGITLDVNHYRSKFNEQQNIVATEEDRRVLNEAIAAFRKLEHVQILPVQDRHDAMLLNYIRYNDPTTQLIDLKWAPACDHSTRTIGEALVAARSNCSRFSSPMINPQSAMILAEQLTDTGAGGPTVVQPLADRITCLELHFDGEMDLDSRLRELSPTFKAVFEAAYNLQAVHVGFPSHRPISLPLEEIFHYVRWERLVAFGIQAWKLDAADIIGIAERHKERLKGLRLRDVQLNEGSKWKDVLFYLRNNLRRLNWVSLRRIGYTKTFDETWGAIGVEVPDDPPGGYSDSDTSSDNDYEEDGGVDARASQEESESDVESLGPETDSERDDESDDEHGSERHNMSFPEQITPDDPALTTSCSCDRSSDIADAESMGPEELGDDGIDVPTPVRRFWERWVVRQCPEHGSRS